MNAEQAAVVGEMQSQSMYMRLLALVTNRLMEHGISTAFTDADFLAMANKPANTLSVHLDTPEGGRPTITLGFVTKEVVETLRTRAAESGGTVKVDDPFLPQAATDKDRAVKRALDNLIHTIRAQGE